MNQPDAMQEEAREPRSERTLALDGSLRAQTAPRSRTALAVAALLFLFPLFAVTVDHWVSTLYHLVAVTCLVAAVAERRDLPPLGGAERTFLWILGAYLAATLAANTLSGWTDASVGWYEADLRIVFMVPILLFLRRHPRAALSLLRAAPVAGVITGAWVIHDTMIDNARFEGAYGPIFAGNVAVLLAVVTLAALRYELWPRPLRIPLHLAGFVLALVAAILTGTRSAWLAALVAIPVTLAFMAKGGGKGLPRVILAVAALVAVLLAAVVTLEPRLTQHRFDLAVEQAEDFLSAAPGAERSEAADSSIGKRLEQWRIGLRIAAEHPVFGIGVGNSGRLINRYVEAGEASPAIYAKNADTGSATHLHSAYFDALVSKGVPGLLTLLALLLYPLWLAIRQGSGLPARAVLAGLAVCFLVFGLTEDPFIRNNFTSIYLLFLACGMALLFDEASRRAG